jgi:NAD(P)-dependent dehydrogenase (short-subunit alcohol dehydrogenase family)
LFGTASKVGIRIVSLAPGVFDTPMMLASPDKVRQPLLGQTPFPKRFGHPEEFAAMVQHVFENALFNGSFIRIDAALRM